MKHGVFNFKEHEFVPTPPAEDFVQALVNGILFSSLGGAKWVFSVEGYNDEFMAKLALLFKCNVEKLSGSFLFFKLGRAILMFKDGTFSDMYLFDFAIKHSQCDCPITQHFRDDDWCVSFAKTEQPKKMTMEMALKGERVD